MKAIPFSFFFVLFLVSCLFDWQWCCWDRFFQVLRKSPLFLSLSLSLFVILSDSSLRRIPRSFSGRQTAGDESTVSDTWYVLTGKVSRLKQTDTLGVPAIETESTLANKLERKPRGEVGKQCCYCKTHVTDRIERDGGENGASSLAFVVFIVRDWDCFVTFLSHTDYGQKRVVSL